MVSLTTPHGTRLRPLSPQKIQPADGCHRRSHTTKPRRRALNFGQRTASRARRQNVVDIGHDPRRQAVQVKPTRSSTAGCMKLDKPSSTNAGQAGNFRPNPSNLNNSPCETGEVREAFPARRQASMSSRASVGEIPRYPKDAHSPNCPSRPG